MKGYFTYKDDRNQLWINDSSNSSLAIPLLHNNKYEQLKTESKQIIESINEIFENQSNSSNWKDISFSQDWETINYELKTNTHYRIFYDVNNKRSTG